MSASSNTSLVRIEKCCGGSVVLSTAGGQLDLGDSLAVWQATDATSWLLAKESPVLIGKLVCNSISV